MDVNFLDTAAGILHVNLEFTLKHCYLWLSDSNIGHMFSAVASSDPPGPAGAAVRPAGRRGPLCLRTLLLCRAPAEAAERQVRHPHEGRLPVGE